MKTRLACGTMWQGTELAFDSGKLGSRFFGDTMTGWPNTISPLRLCMLMCYVCLYNYSLCKEKI